MSDYDSAMIEFHKLVNAAKPENFTKDEVIQWMKLAYIRGTRYNKIRVDG